MEETENPLELGKADANPDLESDTFSNDDISIEGKEVYWTTGQVGNALGISSDMARIHINNFAEYFELKFSKPGPAVHRLFQALLHRGSPRRHRMRGKGRSVCKARRAHFAGWAADGTHHCRGRCSQSRDHMVQ